VRKLHDPPTAGDNDHALVGRIWAI